MLESAVLDSSPVALPPPPKPLKRSASVASLPTPPRTRHRNGKKRGRSRGSLASDSECDSADGASSDSCGEEAGRNGSDAEEHLGDRKRRRTSDTLDDEEAFWLGEERVGRKAGAVGKYRSLKAVASDPEPEMTHHNDQPLLYQRLQQRHGRAGAVNRDKTKAASESATPIALVSPPPSHRKATRIGRTLESATADSSRTASTIRSPAVTPRPKNKGKKRLQRVLELPERDSPNNPFLDSPADDNKVKLPHTPASFEEKPTITYVFRGVRGVYPNPFYNHAKKRAVSPPVESFLPPEHPDFSPDMRCPPRLLFPTRPTKNRTKREEPQESPTTPTRNRTAPIPKPGREHLLKLPKATDAVLGPGPKGRRSLSPYETLGESDEEAGSGAEGGEDDGDLFNCAIKPIKLDFGAGTAAGGGKERKAGKREESLVDEWSKPNLGSRVKH